MKLIIAGSRTITDYNILLEYLEKSKIFDDHDNVEIVSGMAKGIDTLAVEFAEDTDLPIYKFPADWNKYGKKAGHLRNIEMANFADMAIVIRTKISPGSQHMVNTMRDMNKPVYEYIIN